MFASFPPDFVSSNASMVVSGFGGEEILNCLLGREMPWLRVWLCLEFLSCSLS